MPLGPLSPDYVSTLLEILDALKVARVALAERGVVSTLLEILAFCLGFSGFEPS